MNLCREQLFTHILQPNNLKLEEDFECFIVFLGFEEIWEERLGCINPIITYFLSCCCESANKTFTINRIKISKSKFVANFTYQMKYFQQFQAFCSLLLVKHNLTKLNRQTVLSPTKKLSLTLALWDIHPIERASMKNQHIIENLLISIF